MTWEPSYYLDNLEQLKSYVTIPEADTLDDNELEFAAIAAARAIDRATRRQFGKTTGDGGADVAQERYYTAEWDDETGRFVVRTDDFHSLLDFAVHVDSDGDQTYATEIETGIRRLPLNADVNGRPWTRITLPYSAGVSVAEGAVRVSATWGWASVPATIKQANLLQAARFLKRRDAVFGIAGAPEMGIGETRLLDKLDVDVALMVRPYRLSVTA